MTKEMRVLLCVLLASLIALISCQSVGQKMSPPTEGKIRVVKLIIADWENDATGALARSTLLGFEGVLHISEIPRIGQMTVTYDQSKVTLEEMEKTLKDKGIVILQKQ